MKLTKIFALLTVMLISSNLHAYIWLNDVKITGVGFYAPWGNFALDMTFESTSGTTTTPAGETVPARCNVYQRADLQAQVMSPDLGANWNSDMFKNLYGMALTAYTTGNLATVLVTDSGAYCVVQLMYLRGPAS